ncbi:MAG TPA: ribonuclease E inhibitor RraB [Candidatus Eisenbacteria bacterium]|jgi:hypothetical protein|nr:ribonuclease E inhibitor RraB [Candidatus Eisenbacteria bacterium]
MSKTFEEEVLKTLRANGSDVTKAHEFEFYVNVPERRNAVLVADKIKESGYNTELSRSGRHWLVVAKKSFVPVKGHLADQARFFGELAAAVHGDFDGWEAKIVDL